MEAVSVKLEKDKKYLFWTGDEWYIGTWLPDGRMGFFTYRLDGRVYEHWITEHSVIHPLPPSPAELIKLPDIDCEFPDIKTSELVAVVNNKKEILYKGNSWSDIMRALLEPPPPSLVKPS